MSKSLVTLAILATALLTTGLSCTRESDNPEAIDYEADVKPLIETTEKAKVRGSCSVIDTKSTCIDFIGSVFTEERMKLSCEEGKFSFDACPYSDLGGCQAAGGTITESIAWSYNYGGEPISQEEAGYQAKACNALGASKWVLPEDLLPKN
jgi:hypothetical protein